MLVGLLLVILVNAISSCICQPPLRLRIGIIQSIGCELLSLAAQQKFFEQHRLEAEIVHFATRLEAQSALEQEKLDILCSPLSELMMVPVIDRSDFKVILIPDFSNGADVMIARKDAGLHLGELKGARIGLPPASMGELLLNRALADNALSRDDFTVLNQDSKDMADALQQSVIQVAISSLPASLEILKNPDVQIIFQSSQMPGDIIDTLSVTSKLLLARPDLPAKLNDVWDEAVQYLNRHPKDALEFVARNSSIPPEKIRQDYQFLNSGQQDEYLRPQGRLFHLIEQLQNTLLLTGSLKNKRDSQSFLFNPTHP